MRNVRAARRWLIGLLLGGLVRAAPAADDIRALVPAADALPGWHEAEAPRVFRGEDLYELIDGGADLYLEFGFAQVAVGRYAGPGGATLQIEVYQMSDDAAAWGIWSLQQSGKGRAVDAGQAARLFDYYLVMWQGAYFVSVTVTGHPDGVADLLLRAARNIAAKIPQTGQPPALLGRLPADGLQEQRYFRGPLGLTNSYAFAGANPFKVREGVCGVYPGLRLIILRYPGADEAAARLGAAAAALWESGAFREFQPVADGFDGVDADGRQIAARRDNDRIVVRVGEPGGKVPSDK